MSGDDKIAMGLPYYLLFSLVFGCQMVTCSWLLTLPVSLQTVMFQNFLMLTNYHRFSATHSKICVLFCPLHKFLFFFDAFRKQIMREARPFFTFLAQQRISQNICTRHAVLHGWLVLIRWRPVGEASLQGTDGFRHSDRDN